ncbi:MAG: XRE family transcriptional regulator, partial [Actinomycetota bacterium]
LWPSTDRPGGESSTEEIVAAYAHRALLPPQVWREILLACKDTVDLLGFAMLHLPEQEPDLMAILKTKAEGGCQVRVALADPESSQAEDRDAEERLDKGLLARIKTSRIYFSELEGCPGVEIRLHSTPMYNSIFRFDDQMLVTPHLFGIPGSKAPLFHIRRRGPTGIFNNFASHFEAIWQSSQPAKETG